MPPSLRAVFFTLVSPVQALAGTGQVYRVPHPLASSLKEWVVFNEFLTRVDDDMPKVVFTIRLPQFYGGMLDCQQVNYLDKTEAKGEHECALTHSIEPFITLPTSIRSPRAQVPLLRLLGLHRRVRHAQPSCNQPGDSAQDHAPRVRRQQARDRGLPLVAVALRVEGATPQHALITHPASP